jgi:hypothetical protein
VERIVAVSGEFAGGEIVMSAQWVNESRCLEVRVAVRELGHSRCVGKASIKANHPSHITKSLERMYRTTSLNHFHSPTGARSHICNGA